MDSSAEVTFNGERTHRVSRAQCSTKRQRSDALQTRDPGFFLEQPPGLHLRAIAMSFFVYILASRHKGTLYVGVTRNLSRRVSEHKGGFVPGFTKDYRVHHLVYFEEFASILEARARERVLKRWWRE